MRNGHLQNHAISSRNQTWPFSNYFGQAFYGVFFLISKFKCHQLLLKHNLFLKAEVEKKINNPRKYIEKSRADYSYSLQKSLLDNESCDVSFAFSKKTIKLSRR